MDLEKVGSFIRDKRKEKKLTQLELAQKLNISEKTVSKWECGKGFPDTSLILPLCEVLDLNANELLSGKTIKDDKEYKETAEHNLLELKNTNQRLTKNLLNLEYFIIAEIILVLLTATCVISYVSLPLVWKLVIMSFAILNTLIGYVFSIQIETKAGFYKCKHCQHKYIPSYKSSICAMHMGRTKYLKCPKCNKRSWQKKVVD